MKDHAAYIGMLIRNERLNRGLELKDAAEGICAASYLCKIELGQAVPSEALLKDLLSRLDLDYEQDETFLHNLKLTIDRLYDGIFYRRDLQRDLKYLGEHEARVLNSPFRLSYLIILGYLNDRVHPELAAMVPYMDERELAVYILSSVSDEPRPQSDQLKKVHDLLQNSFSLLAYMQGCLRNNRFEELKSLGDQCFALALNEGNLYTLIRTSLLIGTGYASEGHLTVASVYYERAAKLIKSSIWPGLESDINYNLGATFLELGNIEKAAELLRKVPRSNGFSLFHKLAWLALAQGDKTAAKRELAAMKKSMGKDRANMLIYEAAAMQLAPDYESKASSLETIEALIDCLKETRHIGYLRFHRELITKVFIAHRQYKSAYAFERMLGDYARKAE